jgi:DNA phosphorothioation system restriction enzyme
MTPVLKDLSLHISYSSDSGNIIKDFYVPCMRNAMLYRRAVGYFTSHGLSVAAQGIAHLIKNEGKIKLIASPCLTDEDIAAIGDGYKRREEVIREASQRGFVGIENKLMRERLGALAWLIEVGALDVRLAIRVNKDGSLKRGIFHEKMGIFSDEMSNSVAFAGSPNETVGGLVENYESIDVFWSWDDPHGRVNKKIDRFEKLWNNQTEGLETIEFTEISKELLRAYKVEKPPDVDLEEVEETTDMLQGEAAYAGPSIPADVKLRDYQQEAVKNWFKNNGKGTFRFATGTGKTITALAAGINLYQKQQLDAIIIVCPFKHLVNQWAQEARNFGLEPILGYESRGSWETPLTQALLGQGTAGKRLVSFITTNKTFSESFQGKIPYFPRRTLIIADEVHNLGARKLLSSLPDSVPFRLALSATPERWYDPEGTDELIKYFGPVLEPQITLKEAIQKGVLTPYRYYPILVQLTAEESDEYIELSEKIGKLLVMGKETDEENPFLTALLTKRARLIASAQNKLIELQKLMEHKKNETHMLVYCGDGTVDDPGSEEDQRQIEAVCKLLGKDMGIRVAPFVAETSLAEREDLKRQLNSGELQALVAIRCLDEGVDIPAVRAAVILASSRNPRQFIQRRGRILRKAKGKDAAEIFDMIICPPYDIVINEAEKNLLKMELNRFSEFADLALNAGEARLIIQNLKNRYRI